MKQLWVYDLEVFPNLFLLGFKSPKTGKVKIFEISNRKNNSISAKRFLREKVSKLVAFNSTNYDAILLDYFIRTKTKNPAKFYELSQAIINSNSRRENPIIPHLDLFKVLHFDNKAKRSSLKFCEFGLRMPVVQDLPYRFDKTLTNFQIDKVIDYLHHDLDATEALYKEYLDKIYLRTVIQKEYGLRCMNWSDSKIGEKLLLYLYCKKTGRDPEIVNRLRSPRNQIMVKDLLLPIIKFKSKQLQELLKDIKSQIIFNTKGGFKYVFNYGGIETHLAQGGIHASKRGIFKPTKDYKIIDIDVSSLYPTSMINFKTYPEHLGVEFIEVLKDELITPRLKIHKPQSKNKDLHHKQRKLHAAFSDGFKLAAKQKN